MMYLVTLDISQNKCPSCFSLLRSQNFMAKEWNTLPFSWRQFNNCGALGKLVPFVQFKLKNFTKLHDKNVEKNIVVLQNVSFIQSMYEVLFTPTHRKEKFLNLSPAYVSKLCCKEKYVGLFV